MRKGIRIILWFLTIIAFAVCIFAAVSRLVYHRSIAASVIEMKVRSSDVRSLYETKENTEAFLDELKDRDGNEKYEIPQNNELSVSVWDAMIGETKVFFLNDTGYNKKAVLYLPGGSYINQPSKRQWKFAETLALNTDADVIVAIYPKLPQFDYKQAYEDLEQIVTMIPKGFNWKDVTIIGDSSGGCLALGLCEYLSYSGQRQPQNLVLISPWVDATLENTSISDYEKLDPMLAPKGLRILAKAWAGREDEKYYKVSPINGDVTGLGNVTVFAGTREIFYPDAQRLCQKLQNAKVNTKLYIGSGLNHDYPLHNTPEGRKAVKIISDIVCEKKTQMK